MKRLLKKYPVLLFGTVALLILPVRAGARSSDSWEFQLAPYAWLAGLEGDVDAFPLLPPVNVDLDFWDDVFKNLDGALMLVGEARKGHYGVIVDVVYTDLESEELTPGPLFSSVEVDVESWIVTLGVLYRLFEDQPAFFDAIAGVRYWSLDKELSFQGGFDAASIGLSNREEWLDPFIGLKGLTAISQSRFFFSGFLLLGGFGAGSDFMWDATANVGYRWTNSFSTTIGYRYLDVDYDEDDFLYDIAQHGPILGLSWRF